MAAPFERASDQFSINPQTLRDAAPNYQKVAQDVSSLQQSLTSSMQTASGDMFALLEFAQLASRLEQLQQRINSAMQCAAMGLNRIGTALSIAADEYQSTDEQVSQTFTRIEDDQTPWTKPAITFPSITPPTDNPGNVPGWGQQPNLWPQQQPRSVPVQTPELPPLETGPGFIFPNVDSKLSGQ
jgi:uncharacterized protein YukE